MSSESDMSDLGEASEKLHHSEALVMMSKRKLMKVKLPLKNKQMALIVIYREEHVDGEKKTSSNLAHPS